MYIDSQLPVISSHLLLDSCFLNHDQHLSSSSCIYLSYIFSSECSNCFCVPNFILLLVLCNVQSAVTPFHEAV
jgi:hypothetical protein